MTTTVYDDKGNEKSITVAQDEGIRPNTTMEGLAKLKPAFKQGGSTTAGETGLWQGAGVRMGLLPCWAFSMGGLEPPGKVHVKGVDPLSPAPIPR